VEGKEEDEEVNEETLPLLSHSSTHFKTFEVV
jgi:hypothetical protein